MEKVFGFYCIKGGVGKTTFATNFTSFISRYTTNSKGEKNKCLLIDLDLQGSASSSLGLRTEELERNETIAQVFLDENFDLKKIIKDAGDFDLIPCNMELNKVNGFLAMPNNVALLKEKIDELKNLYDFIFIDLPPNTDNTTICGVVACDEIIIPAECDKLSFDGIGHVIKFFNNDVNMYAKVKGLPDRKILGVILNKVQRGVGLHKGYLEEGRKEIRKAGLNCFENVLHEGIVIAESHEKTKTLFEYDLKANITKEFVNIGNEFINLIKDKGE